MDMTMAKMAKETEPNKELNTAEESFSNSGDSSCEDESGSEYCPSSSDRDDPDLKPGNKNGKNLRAKDDMEGEPSIKDESTKYSRKSPGSIGADAQLRSPVTRPQEQSCSFSDGSDTEEEPSKKDQTTKKSKMSPDSSGIDTQLRSPVTRPQEQSFSFSDESDNEWEPTKKDRTTKKSRKGPESSGIHSHADLAKMKRPWTVDEKNAVWRHFGKHLTLGRVPGKKDCESCLSAEKTLKQRSWRDVKNFVYNSIVSRKRKVETHNIPT